MRSRADIEAALLSKGFRQKNADHRFFVFYTASGVKSRIRTKTSHGARDVGKPLIAQMAKQVALTTGEFLRLVDCPLTRAEYEKKIADRL